MTTTFEPLQARDVEIGMIDRQGFVITTTTEKYQVVRNCLTILKEQEGLPLDYASETEATKYSVFPKEILDTIMPNVIIKDPDGILPNRIENHFIVPSHRKVGTDLNKVKALVEQVATRLRSLYLKVEVNEDSSVQPKMHKEEEFIYTVMVTAVAYEIAKVPKDHEVWNGIPSLIKIMARTGELDAMKEIVGRTPPLLETVPELLKEYKEKVQEAVEKCENFHESWVEGQEKENIAKLNLEPPTSEAMEILKRLQKYHQS